MLLLNSKQATSIGCGTDYPHLRQGRLGWVSSPAQNVMLSVLLIHLQHMTKHTYGVNVSCQLMLLKSLRFSLCFAYV